MAETPIFASKGSDCFLRVQAAFERLPGRLDHRLLRLLYRSLTRLDPESYPGSGGGNVHQLENIDRYVVVIGSSRRVARG